MKHKNCDNNGERMTETSKAPPQGFVPADMDYGFAACLSPFYLKREEDGVTVGFYVEEQHINPGQIAHGGMLMTVIDMAFGINIGAKVEDSGFLPTTSLSYDFVQAAYLGDWIESKIEFLHITHKRAVISGFLVGPKGVVVRANGTNKIMRRDDKRFVLPEELKKEFNDRHNMNHD